MSFSTLSDKAVDMGHAKSAVNAVQLSAVVFADNGDSPAVLTSQLDTLLSEKILDSVEYCDVGKSGFTSSLPGSTRVFIFLLNADNLKSAGSSEAAYFATRKAVTGKALVIPVVLNSNLNTEDSAFAFAKPLYAHANNFSAAVASIGSSVREFQLKLQSSVPADSKVQGDQVVSEVPVPVIENPVLENKETTERTAPTFKPALMPAPTLEKLAGAFQIAESVDPLPCHMSSYDDFIENLIGRLQVMRMHDRKRNLNIFAEAVHKVLGAEMVYCYYRSKRGELHIYEADSNSDINGCSSIVVHGVLEETLKSYSHDLDKRSLRLQNFLPQLAQSGDSNIECMVVVNQDLPNCGVFVAAKGGFTRFPMTEILSTVINTLHDALAWARFETFENLKARVYDELRRTYRFVSDDMYEDRRRIFRNQLEHISVQFEPMFRFDKQTQDVSIFAYEALARARGASAAPAEIFKTASLWGMSFQSELDSTLLKTSIDGYRQQLVSQSIPSAMIKPLSLNVYPATLRSAKYRELLYELLSKAKPLCGHHLIMEVSEKTVVSPEVQIEARQELESYRGVIDQLMHLTDVRFAIDDFGVGNSSLSRLERLKPHYVKIDRDILSFDANMASTLIRYLIDSQKQQGADVILEGVDIHSGLSLDQLVNDLGVDIIQGHSLSKAVSGFDELWEQQICDRVKGELGWSNKISSEGLVLH